MHWLISSEETIGPYFTGPLSTYDTHWAQSPRLYCCSISFFFWSFSTIRLFPVSLLPSHQPGPSAEKQAPNNTDLPIVTFYQTTTNISKQHHLIRNGSPTKCRVTFCPANKKNASPRLVICNERLCKDNPRFRSPDAGTRFPNAPWSAPTSAGSDQVSKNMPTVNVRLPWLKISQNEKKKKTLLYSNGLLKNHFEF